VCRYSVNVRSRALAHSEKAARSACTCGNTRRARATVSSLAYPISQRYRPVTEVAKKHGISEVTIYAWRKRFGTLEAVDVKRLRQLELRTAG
jgi:transposase-like protein